MVKAVPERQSKRSPSTSGSAHQPRPPSESQPDLPSSAAVDIRNIVRRGEEGERSGRTGEGSKEMIPLIEELDPTGGREGKRDSTDVPPLI